MFRGMDSLAKIVGDNIARERTIRGWTQAALAQEIDRNAQTVYRWETQKTWPSAKDFEDLAAVFKVPPWSLMAPPGPQKVSKAPEPDPKIREAVGTICRALGIPPPRGGSKG